MPNDQIVVFVLVSAVILSIFYGSWRSSQQEKVELKKEREEEDKYNQKCAEDEDLCQHHLGDLSWPELLELRRRHGRQYASMSRRVSLADSHQCIVWHKHPDGGRVQRQIMESGKICWIQVVNKEIEIQ